MTPFAPLIGAILALVSISGFVASDSPPETLACAPVTAIIAVTALVEATPSTTTRSKPVFERLKPRRRSLVVVPTGTRPKTRGDCARVERPCPFVSCRHSLYLDVFSPKEVSPLGTIKRNFASIDEMAAASSCALDIADRGPHTLEEVSLFMRISDERVRQIDLDAREKLARNGGAHLRSIADQFASGMGEMVKIAVPAKRPASPTIAMMATVEKGEAMAAEPAVDVSPGIADDGAGVSETKQVSEPKGEEGEGPMGATNGTTSDVVAIPPGRPPREGTSMPKPPIADDTAKLVADVQEARARLRERRDKLRAELAAAESALESDDEVEERHEAPPPKPTANAQRTATPPPRLSKKKTAAATPKPVTRQEYLTWLRHNPRARSQDAASALGKPRKTLEGIFYAMRKAGQVRSESTTRGNLWSAASA